uniref:GRF-type domain-containing protein n=1 Tax=Astyanax mexicanus TaxID=7994 RepID=A0A8B9J8K1_ASTMX
LRNHKLTDPQIRAPLLHDSLCKGRRFYACSACRDRKDCNFFQWENEKVQSKIWRVKITQLIFILRTHCCCCYITVSQLRRPSLLLSPLENKKSNAQYLFAERSCRFLLEVLSGLGFRKFLCVGTPRWVWIHAYHCFWV